MAAERLHVGLGLLIKLGCRLQWAEGECALWHPTRGRIGLDVKIGCPRIPKTLALELIEEVERFRVEAVGAASKAIRARQNGTLPGPQAAVTALTQAIIREQGVALSLREAVIALWPRVPDELLQDLVETGLGPRDPCTSIAGKEGPSTEPDESWFTFSPATPGRRLKGSAKLRDMK